MNNKCDWKNGKFEPCEEFDGRFLERDLPDDKDDPNYCLYCQTDIRKPEEKPLIIKSGKTWVAHLKGVDYLCLIPENLDTIIRVKNDFSYCVIEDKYYKKWKPFSEIELTDEIAGTLRPMIKHLDFICQLIHIQDEGLKHIYNKKEDRYYTVNHCQLATPHELQEEE